MNYSPDVIPLTQFLTNPPPEIVDPKCINDKVDLLYSSSESKDTET